MSLNVPLSEAKSRDDFLMRRGFKSTLECVLVEEPRYLIELKPKRGICKCFAGVTVSKRCWDSWRRTWFVIWKITEEQIGLIHVRDWALWVLLNSKDCNVLSYMPTFFESSGHLGISGFPTLGSRSSLNSSFSGNHFCKDYTVLHFSENVMDCSLPNHLVQNRILSVGYRWSLKVNIASKPSE